MARHLSHRWWAAGLHGAALAYTLIINITIANNFGSYRRYLAGRREIGLSLGSSKLTRRLVVGSGCLLRRVEGA
uniref:Uncharacterized protein n=1 Tax=Rhizophora mucronata TaxID=61149 RepID=A0A2P2PMC5_RHIMU